MPAQTPFDVIIAGAGLAGSTLACALLRGGLRVALIDPAPPAQPALDQGFDQRVYAITRSSENIFRNLGLWPDLARIAPYHAMQVWEQRGSIHFDSAELGEPNLGHIIEGRVLMAALQTALNSHPDLARFPQRLTAVNVSENFVEAVLDDGSCCQGLLLAGADGAESQVRQLAGIDCRATDYGHHAIVATVTTDLPHENTAWQHFMPSGPLAFLPLPEPHTSSIVWSTEPQHAAQLMQLPEDAFNRALESAFEGRLGMIAQSTGRTEFPLRRRHAEHYVKQRLALLGDAAHTIHPLAGQGINLGFMDAAALADVLLTARAHRHDLGTYRVLRRYERWRKGDNQSMLWLMDAFRHLFASRVPAVAWLRNTGLNLTGAMPVLKQTLMRQALGTSGSDLPALAQLPRAMS